MSELTRIERAGLSPLWIDSDRRVWEVAWEPPRGWANARRWRRTNWTLLEDNETRVRLFVPGGSVRWRTQLLLGRSGS